MPKISINLTGCGKALGVQVVLKSWNFLETTFQLTKVMKIIHLLWSVPVWTCRILAKTRPSSATLFNHKAHVC